MIKTSGILLIIFVVLGMLFSVLFAFVAYTGVGISATYGDSRIVADTLTSAENAIIGLRLFGIIIKLPLMILGITVVKMSADASRGYVIMVLGMVLLGICILNGFISFVITSGLPDYGYIKYVGGSLRGSDFTEDINLFYTAATISIVTYGAIGVLLIAGGNIRRKTVESEYGYNNRLC